MINTQLLTGVLVALAMLVGTAIVLSVAILAARIGTKPGQAPHGGIRRDLPQQPQPGTDGAHGGPRRKGRATLAA